jgi:hypothetical protein
MTDILGLCFEGLSIRPVTKNLVEHLMLDLPLTPAEVVDFGVDTPDHYRVLQIIVRDAGGVGVDLEDEVSYGLVLLEMQRIIAELDQALGNSAKLNEMVHSYVPEYADRVKFRTSWDVLLAGSDTTANMKSL